MDQGKSVLLDFEADCNKKNIYQQLFLCDLLATEFKKYMADFSQFSSCNNYYVYMQNSIRFKYVEDTD